MRNIEEYGSSASFANSLRDRLNEIQEFWTAAYGRKSERHLISNDNVIRIEIEFRKNPRNSLSVAHPELVIPVSEKKNVLREI